MIKALKDTRVPDMVRGSINQDMNYNIPANMVEGLLNVLVMGTTNALAQLKSKDWPVAFVFRKPNEDFIACAIVQFFPNEDPKKPGNWNYSWSFYEDDLPKNANVKTIYDGPMLTFFKSASVNKYKYELKEPQYYGDILCYILMTVKKWLDENATEGEEQGVKIDGVIQFRVAIENGEKVFSAEPEGEIKQIIKDDSAIEV